jgi:methylmalonyl-CoA/ethylmalonyl-CoA epimerase
MSKLPIKRLDHVSMAAPRLEDQLRFFEDLFGMRVVERFDAPGTGFVGAALSIPGTGINMEVIAPAGEGSFLDRFLRDRGPALHHLTFEVTDIEAAARVLREQGIEPFGRSDDADWKQLFIHPRDSGGVLIQLYENVAEVREGS